MKVRINESKFTDKCCKFLFHDDRPDHLSIGFGVAFPFRFEDGRRSDIPYDIFRDSLQPGLEVDVFWSKRLHSYVARL